MATVDVFDVTAAEVADFIQGVSTFEDPDTAAVTRWITESASRVWGALRSRDKTPDDVNSSAEDADLELYNQCREYVSMRVAAKWHMANQNGDPEVARSYRIEFAEWLRAMRDEPQYTAGSECGLQVRRANPIPSGSRVQRWPWKTSYR